MKNFILLTVVVAGYALGIYFYSTGFLLTRHTLGKNNTCSESRNYANDDSTIDASTKTRSICWLKARFRRAIWIVIDALRYDFVAPVSDNINEYYHNKLTIVAELLSQQPRNSLLYRFIADAPTTTLQRLKGMTTGSLPTFVDAGQNFGGTEIEEDNIIDQLVRLGRNITFMGDDTWTTLFPTQFSRSFPFPSFDVKDLHTVDNGILEHLFEELTTKKDTWDVLIAHFLGVDHCGHKYGPNHPEMAAKLEQMDRVLRRVIESMDPDTVLFVVGDHGMTQSGDHGGDSGDEVNAALFVYSPFELHREEVNVRGSVSQIDLVPTMALLLDVPIPFSNLGKVIIDMFPDQKSRSRSAEANVLQVFHFTEMYLANFRDPLLIDQLQPVFTSFYAQETDELTAEKSLEYINRISRVFVECWAKFHMGWMALGIVTLLETFLWLIALLIDWSNSITGRRVMLKAALFMLSFWVVLAREETIPPMVGILSSLLIIFHVHTIVVSLWNPADGSGAFIPSYTTALAGLILVAHGLSQFSNSYVVYEDKLSHYFAASLVVLLFCGTISTAPKATSFKQNIAEKKRRSMSALSRFFHVMEAQFGWKSLTYCVAALILLRLAVLFGRCREEQFPCVSSFFTLPFASLLDENLKIVRIVVAIISLLLLYWLPQRFLAYNGNLTGGSLFCLIFQFGHIVMIVLTGSYWILQWLPERSIANAPTSVHLFPPLLCYCTFAAIIFAFLVNPILSSVHQIENRPVLDKRLKSPLLGTGILTESEAVRRAYEHLKINWRYYLSPPNKSTNDQSDERPRWAVFGLATGYSGPFVAIFVSFAVLFALLLGDGFTFPLVVFGIAGLASLELCSENDAFVFVVLLCELCSCFFYSFGHQPTFATIPWDAAFIGIPGNFRFRWVQGAMVVLRIGVSNVLAIFLLPLKACWSYYRKKLGPYAARRTLIASEDSFGEELGMEAEILTRRRDSFLSEVTYLNCAYLAASSVKMLCSTLASALHRRHLMVWKVFAPKFIFDGVHFLLTCGAIMVQYLLVVRLHRALGQRFANAEFIRQHKLK